MTGWPEQHFTEEIQVTNKDRNSCSDRHHKKVHHLHPLDLQKLRTLIVSSDRDAMGQQDHLYSADRRGHWTQSLQKTMWQFCEVKRHHSNSTHRNEQRSLRPSNSMQRNEPHGHPHCTWTRRHGQECSQQYHVQLPKKVGKAKYPSFRRMDKSLQNNTPINSLCL